MQRGITEIKGIQVGHYTDLAAKTGCTAIVMEQGAVAGVDVRGSAPGTRETDLLRGYNQVEAIHAILLSGGSAYGLDAASGAMQYLEEKGIGFPAGPCVVPIVPAAVIFDLGVGNPLVRPGKQEGYLACQNARYAGGVLQGAVGAGTGATVGKGLGPQYAMASGIGSAAVTLEDGVILAALTVVNALGDIYDHHTGQMLAGPWVDGVMQPSLGARGGFQASVPGNTTIGVIATNARLNREEANKLASIAHDGLALAIRPVHTSLDGDTMFAIATGEVKTPFINLLAMAGEVVAQAIQNAVAVDK